MGFISKLFKRGTKGKSKSSERYFSSSEFVSCGHPDRVADLIASIVINDIQKKDGWNSHAAVEVFLTHDTVYFGGEVTTTLEINKEYLEGVVKEGFERAGYLPKMREYWTKKEVMLAEDMKIVNKICAQSPDIALGTTDKGEESGWNDQGVYFSSCDDTNYYGIGFPHAVASDISTMLHKYSKESIESGEGVILGPDNKCVITMLVESDGFTPICVTDITIAVAHTSKNTEEEVKAFVYTEVTKYLRSAGIHTSAHCKWTINGTGRFVVHGCVSDTSMTGRKISVNHPSAGPVWSNKMIGGGSLVKPAHASDLMMNLMARYISEVVVSAGLSRYAVVGCSGAIGATGYQSLFIKGDADFEKVNKDKVYAFFGSFVNWSPKGIATKFGFFDEDFDFSKVVESNFFGYCRYQPWEEPSIIETDARALNAYLEFKG